MTDSHYLRPRQRTVLAAIAAFALLLTGCGASTQTESADTVSPEVTAPVVAVAEAPAPAPASDFPDFVGTTADGGQIDFASLEGQDTVLWFWAPW